MPARGAGNLNLSGPLPDVAASDSQLQVLTLYNNNFTGTLPASFGNAAQLVNLDLSGNGLTGAQHGVTFRLPETLGAPLVGATHACAAPRVCMNGGPGKQAQAGRSCIKPHFSQRSCLHQ